jgi:hypothetical protein
VGWIILWSYHRETFPPRAGIIAEEAVDEAVVEAVEEVVEEEVEEEVAEDGGITTIAITTTTT